MKNISPKLPIRDSRSNTTELHWVDIGPIEWLSRLNENAKAVEPPRPSRRQQENDWAAIVHSSRSPITPPRFSETFADKQVSNSAAAGSSAAIHSPPMNSPNVVCLPGDIELLLSKFDDPTQMPSKWDMRPLQSTPIVDRMRRLALLIESHSNFAANQASFEQIRSNFESELSLEEHRPSGESLEQSCIETTHKLHGLLLVLLNGASESRSFPDVAPSDDGSRSTQSGSAGSNKAAFHAHMNNWLRSNWINPYTDDAISHQLAFETGESLHVVNTWLVNARSRRWRPSIMKAYELKRPSEMLLEDSINIFEDMPLRSIDEHDRAVVDDDKAKKRARIR